MKGGIWILAVYHCLSRLEFDFSLITDGGSWWPAKPFSLMYTAISPYLWCRLGSHNGNI